MAMDPREYGFRPGNYEYRPDDAPQGHGEPATMRNTYVPFYGSHPTRLGWTLIVVLILVVIAVAILVVMRP